MSQSEKFILPKKIETRKGEMSILNEIERNKDPRSKKAMKVIRKYKCKWQS